MSHYEPVIIASWSLETPTDPTEERNYAHLGDGWGHLINAPSAINEALLGCVMEPFEVSGYL